MKVRTEDDPEVTTDDKDIVSALRIALADKVGTERFELWFGANTRLEFDDRTLSISAPNRFFLDWIRSNFRQHIDQACCEVLGKNLALSFNVDDALDDVLPEEKSTAKSETKAKQTQRGNSNGSTLQSEPALRVLSTDDSNGASSATEPSSTFTKRKFDHLESFVQGYSNRLAFASAQMAAQSPGKLTPLLIHGPTGVGKTHLLEGIWTAAKRSRRNVTPIYLTAEQFTSYFLEALRGSGLPNFRRKYRSVGLLIIDNLQFFAGKRATQIELLHTVDTFLREGRQLVFTADRHPGELAEMGTELTTRLEGGMVCCIEPPEYATRLGIVERMAQRMKLGVPADVQQFIAARLTNHTRELSGALCRLQATSVSLGLDVTLTMAEEALSEMICNSGRVVQLGDIERAVCNVFGLDSSSLHSTRKAKSVSHPRMLAMWLARKHTRAALSEIGRYFGRRSHSTVISAQKRVDLWMADGRQIDLSDKHLNVDEAIRKVERQLAVG